MAEISCREFCIADAFIGLVYFLVGGEIRTTDLRNSRGWYYRQALPGMTVCLQFLTSGGPRYCTRRKLTPAAPESFSLASFTHELDFFQRWEGYTIKVTDARVQDNLPQPCGGLVTLSFIDERQKMITKERYPGIPFFLCCSKSNSAGIPPLAAQLIGR